MFHYEISGLKAYFGCSPHERQSCHRHSFDAMDESSPHMHVLVVLLTHDGRLCAKEIMGRAELTRMQADYSKVTEQLGL